MDVLNGPKLVNSELLLQGGQSVSLKYTFRTQSELFNYNLASISLPAGLEIDAGCLSEMMRQGAVQDYEQCRSEVKLYWSNTSKLQSIILSCRAK